MKKKSKPSKIKISLGSVLKKLFKGPGLIYFLEGFLEGSLTKNFKYTIRAMSAIPKPIFALEKKSVKSIINYSNAPLYTLLF